MLLKFSNKNDITLLQKRGFLENEKNRLCIEFITVLMEQKKDYLEYIKNEEESIVEKFSNR